jgi:CHAD domain-containing protein
MAFRFHRREKARAAFRRVGIELIEEIGQHLDPRNGPLDVHAARKASKMIRAMLRLFQSGLSHSTRRTETVRFREIARLLSTARDAEVRLATFRAMSAAPNLQMWIAVRRIEEHLAKSAQHEAPQTLSDETLARARTMLAWALSRWQKLRLKGHEWNLLEAGLHDTYLSTTRGYDAFRRDLNDATAHEWRKAVKALGYEVLLLRCVRPSKLKILWNKLDALGEILGDHHDISVLRTYLAGKSWAAEGLALLEPRISQRQSELCVEAERIALEVLVKSPSEFIEQFAK